MQIGTITSMAVISSPAVRLDGGHGNQSPVRDAVPQQSAERVSAEEFLKKVQGLTEGGQHSVRFEIDKDVNMMVVKIFDSKSNEMIEQIPAESLLGAAKALQDYRRGLVVDDKS